MELGNGEMIVHLEKRLTQELAGRIGDFRLLIQENGLILKGRARSYYAKQLAQQLTMQATAVPILANQIEVAHR